MFNAQSNFWVKDQVFEGWAHLSVSVMQHEGPLIVPSPRQSGAGGTKFRGPKSAIGPLKPPSPLLPPPSLPPSPPALPPPKSWCFSLLHVTAYMEHIVRSNILYCGYKG